MKNKIINLYRKNEEIINYVIVGALTTFVSIFSFYIFRVLVFKQDTQLHIQICTIISWILAVLFAFFTNNKYVFKNQSGKDSTIKKMIKFFASRITTLFIEMFVMWFLTSPLNINDKISKILVQFIVFILNYIFSKIFVFKKN